MDKHRTVHDFSELTYEDIDEPSSAVARFISEKRYHFLLGAVAIGILFGFLAKRK
ncbi:MAG: hypothetical protein ABIQ35_07390 [Verrucomicrobiota bacterium]